MPRQKGRAPHSVQAMRREFSDPPAQYRPIDCWWWEAARLSRDRMREQLEDLKAKGIAGTWFYPRYMKGEPLQSDPPYWSEGWWDFTAFSLREHKRLGLVCWISDWTAQGFFQDKVRAERRERPEMTGKRLAIYEREVGRPGTVQIEVPAEERILHAAAYRKTGDGLDHASQVPLDSAVADNTVAWDSPGRGWALVVITAQPHDLDYLNRAVVDRWIELFLHEYELRVPEALGTTLQAYGPDEMYILQGNVLYSVELIKRFTTAKGYDPLPYLAGIFRDIGPKTDKIRCDYYDVMISLLDENFYKPIADWLHERGMLYTTIATWGREDPVGQTYHYGDFFRMMSHFDVTGNEDPGDTEADRRRLVDAKLSSSVAHLYLRQRAAVCAYWGSGWGATQEENLAWTLANYAWGINLYNQHGGLYSTLAGWYEWVPPAVQFRQPYWQYWSHFTDWVRRLSYIMSQGTPVADVAILYPLTTMHAGWASGDRFSAAACEAGARMVELARAIYRGGNDFDFIDDASLCRAHVLDARLSVSGLEFSTVVLPPLTTIRTDTLEKLREFWRSGGTVIAVGRLPDASPEHGREDPNVRAIIADMFCREAVDARPSSRERGRAFFVADDLTRVPKIISDAITRDIVVAEDEVFHAHRRTDDADIFLLYNARHDKRRISATLRVRGETELWDPFTGDTRPIHRCNSEGDTTKIILDMEPLEGAVIVVSSARKGTRPAHHDAAPVAGERLDAVSLGGSWALRLEPTMDNRWGDYRHPPSDEMIGPEARRFRYAEEGGHPGTSLGWHTKACDDSGWPFVTCTYGPYWWTLGPFGEEHEPKHVLDSVVAGQCGPNDDISIAGRPLHWKTLGFSVKYGSLEGQGGWGGLEGVSDAFLTFHDVPGERNVVRYLFAHVISPGEKEWTLDFGGKAELERQAWVNGEEVISVGTEKKRAQGRVTLKEGRNAVVLRIVQPHGKSIRTYAVFFETSSPPAADPYVPLLRWFTGRQELLFDVTPDIRSRVGWYRFVAPPGLTSMRLDINAKKVEAWVDGEPISAGTVSASAGRGRLEIALPSRLTKCSQVALRVTHEPCFYEGAAFSGPVMFNCGDGEIELGDWCDYGLQAYSGGAVYSTTVTLEKRHLEGPIQLDLGSVVTVAEVCVNGRPAGLKMGRPFRFDITGLVAEGRNEIRVKVANTLANHMSSYPTAFIFPGQTVSGLLGPVTLHFLHGPQPPLPAPKDDPQE